ncbi:MAG: translation initiation factor IF-3 [Mycoplasmataceae bacterium RC_NB112A]|nr:MAG: translation initiation factor IF-3 [Mycoplasmataceae bacterium RC_NB112A]
MVQLKKENQPLLNEAIYFPNFLLIDEEGKKNKVTRWEGLKKAEETGLDLLCVSLRPPVCKLVNYYALKKKQKKPKKISPQEIRISYNIEENDLEVKLKKVRKLLKEIPSIKVSLILKGREKEREKAKVAKDKCQQIIEKLQAKSLSINLKGEIQETPNSLYFFLYQKKK